MSKIEELERKLEEVQAEVEDLKKELEEKSKAKFKQLRNGYVSTKEGPVMPYVTPSTEPGALPPETTESGFQVCKDRKTAERYGRMRRFHAMLFQIAELLNDGWEPDWSDGNQRKNTVRHDHDDRNYTVTTHFHGNANIPVFETYQKAETAIKWLTEEYPLGPPL